MKQDITKIDLISIVKTLTNIITSYDAGDRGKITEDGIKKFREDKTYFETLLNSPEFSSVYCISHDIDMMKVTTLNNDVDFINFIRKIAVENDDEDMPITSLIEAKNYLKNYCSNLTLL